MKLDKYWIDFILDILWKLAAVIGIFMFSYLFTQLIFSPSKFIENNSSLLATFFILLSASIASASIMKSIQASKELKDKELAQTQLGELIYLQSILLQLNRKCNVLKDTRSKENGLKDILDLWNKVLVDKYFIFFLNYDAKEILEYYGASDAIYSISKSLHDIQTKHLFDISNDIKSIIAKIKILQNSLNTELEKSEKKLGLVKPPNIPIIKTLLQRIDEKKKQ